MLNGLDLFSGIGGLSIALNEWIRPVAYCEIDPYCQGVLLSQMASGRLGLAPIWDDIKTFPCDEFARKGIDIISGGFPCQDISVAGHGKGLEGERSGLFFEIVRLAKEIKPKFIFLENVPAICSRGGLRVVREITEMGYDCRWCVISAASVGALHLRERWFLLAHARRDRGGADATRYALPTQSKKLQQSDGKTCSSNVASVCSDVAYSRCFCEGMSEEDRKDFYDDPEWTSFHDSRCSRFWEAEPNVGRVVDGLPKRVDRIKALGNAVVPQQARKAFRQLLLID